MAITIIRIDFLCSKPKSKYFSIICTITFRIRSLIVLTCRRTLQKCGKDHTILLVLPSGIYHYKFIVDGNVKYIPDLPYEADEMGNVVNLLDVCVSNISKLLVVIPCKWDVIGSILSVLLLLFLIQCVHNCDYIFEQLQAIQKRMPTSRFGIIMPFVFIFMDGKLYEYIQWEWSAGHNLICLGPRIGWHHH